MSKFKIAVTWSVSGTYDVEANTLKEAKEKVLAEKPYDALPKGKYIDDSMEVDMDTTRELNGLGLL